MNIPTAEELKEFQIGIHCNMCAKKLSDKDKQNGTNCCAKCIRSSF